MSSSSCAATSSCVAFFVSFKDISNCLSRCAVPDLLLDVDLSSSSVLGLPLPLTLVFALVLAVSLVSFVGSTLGFLHFLDECPVC